MRSMSGLLSSPGVALWLNTMSRQALSSATGSVEASMPTSFIFGSAGWESQSQSTLMLFITLM